MQPAVRETSGGYWQPAKGSATTPEAVLPESLCRQCATEFAIGARFCHVCGFDRESFSDNPAQAGSGFVVDLEILRARLGLGTASMVCLIAGIACLLAAFLSGYTTQVSAMEWPAKTARVLEWLLAGIAAFVAGVLLKK